MIITKAKIKQSISLSDEDLEKLSKVKGNVYIMNQNSGNVELDISLSFDDCVRGLYDSGLSFKQILFGVRAKLVELAMSEYHTPTLAARRLQMPRKLIYYHAAPKEKGPGEITQAP